MIKTLLVFVCISLVFAFAIYMYREMTGKERWEVIKIVGYASICSLFSLVFLAALVVAF